MSFDEALLEGLNDACIDTLGEAVTVGGETIDAIFDNGFEGLSSFGIGVESSKPTLTCKSKDVIAIHHGCDAVVKDILYHVVGVQPDGTGITVLELEEQ